MALISLVESESDRIKDINRLAVPSLSMIKWQPLPFVSLTTGPCEKSQAVDWIDHEVLLVPYIRLRAMRADLGGTRPYAHARGQGREDLGYHTTGHDCRLIGAGCRLLRGHPLRRGSGGATTAQATQEADLATRRLRCRRRRAVLPADVLLDGRGPAFICSRRAAQYAALPDRHGPD